MGKKYSTGFDYGTGTSGLLVFDAENKEQMTVSVFSSSDSGFTNGLYSYPAKDQLKPHPFDYLEKLETNTIKKLSIDTIGMFKINWVNARRAQRANQNQKGIIPNLILGYKNDKTNKSEVNSIRFIQN